MHQHNILLFGELLLRLSPQQEEFFNSDNSINLFPGGSEANVATSLGQWNVPNSYVSCIPDNELTKQILKNISDKNVKTDKCILRDGRLGLYFLLSANGLTKGEVIYDRSHSSFFNLRPGEIDWDTLLEGHAWFHWSALTPALNSNLADVMEEALIAAKKKGLTISVDLNYRNRLWNYGKSPNEVMPRLVQYCDVIMGNIWAANEMLSIPVDNTLNRASSTREEYIKEANESAKSLFHHYPNCKHIAYTFRFMDSPVHNLLYGTYHTPSQNYVSDSNETYKVIDRIGSGDAFMAGLIYGLSTNKEGQELINLATSAGFKKLFVKGDFGNGDI